MLKLILITIDYHRHNVNLLYNFNTRNQANTHVQTYAYIWYILILDRQLTKLRYFPSLFLYVTQRWMSVFIIVVITSNLLLRFSVSNLLLKFIVFNGVNYLLKSKQSHNKKRLTANKSTLFLSDHPLIYYKDSLRYVEPWRGANRTNKGYKSNRLAYSKNDSSYTTKKVFKCHLALNLTG